MRRLNSQRRRRGRVGGGVSRRVSEEEEVPNQGELRCGGSSGSSGSLLDRRTAGPAPVVFHGDQSVAGSVSVDPGVERTVLDTKAVFREARW